MLERVGWLEPEDGAVATEYVLIATVIGLVMLVGASELGRAVDALFSNPTLHSILTN